MNFPQLKEESEDTAQLGFKMELLGWGGALCLAFCGVPELIKTVKTKKCSIGWGFLILWGLGEVFTLVPVIGNNLGAYLTFNYTLNILIILILIYYKVKNAPYKLRF
jgi:uncharacterized protein with PQ loop repeat